MTAGSSDIRPPDSALLCMKRLWLWELTGVDSCHCHCHPIPHAPQPRKLFFVLTSAGDCKFKMFWEQLEPQTDAQCGTAWPAPSRPVRGIQQGGHGGCGGRAGAVLIGSISCRDAAVLHSVNELEGQSERSAPPVRHFQLCRHDLFRGLEVRGTTPHTGC